jgi:murein L,D-transpeptidase YcbB/YkuD
MVVVNIAGYSLHLFLEGQRVWTTRTIVGKSYTKTPVFTAAMKSVVFNPDWTVPRSIVRNEIFPKAARDPDYLARNDYQLMDAAGARISPTAVAWNQWTPSSFPFRVVQQPGSRNALGLVKFLFPNKHSVYLHDTPSRQLFLQSARAFSHGCIRVQDPLKLAELILANRLGWDRSKIDRIVAEGKLRSVTLPKPVPVLLLYWTMDPTFDGGAHFFDDIYGRDAALINALDARFAP